MTGQQDSRLHVTLTGLCQLSPFRFQAKWIASPDRLTPSVRTAGFGVLAWSFLAVALTLPVRAEETTRPDPLGPIVEEALEANRGLEQVRLAEKRAAAEVSEAIALWLPHVTVGSRISEMDGVPNLGDLINPAYSALNDLTGSSAFPTDIDIELTPRHETRLSVTQPLLAEPIRANLSAARARREARTLESGVAARKIAAAAQISYLQEASARRVVAILEAALERATEIERVAERLVAAGRSTPEAVLRARADRSDVEQQLAESRQQHRAALRELNRLLQRPLDQPAEIIEGAAFEHPIGLTSDAVVEHALGIREELGAARATIRAAKAGRRAVTSRYLPSLSAGFDYGFQGSEFSFHSDEDYWVVSLVANLEIFDFGREAQHKAAGYDVERAQVALLDLEDQVRLEVRNAYEAAVTEYAAIATAESRLDAARRTFDLVRHRYEEGVASSLELVDARTALTAAELNRVLTAYRYAIRWVDLERAAALREIEF